MIEYDYSMTKINGTEISRFEPLFKTHISNVSTFRGHNSSGKSTFMDLVALSLYGRDSPEVISKLKEKLNYLYSSDNSDFLFNLKADNGQRILRSRFSKEGFIDGNEKIECIVEESVDGGLSFKELTKEKFRKKYRVIYDMPDRPMERIQELVREAERITRKTQDILNQFRYPLDVEISEAENSRNEDYIFLLKTEVSNKKEACEKIEEQVASVKLLSDKLNRLYYASVLCDLIDEKTRIEQQLNVLKDCRNQEQKKIKKENKDYDKKLKELRKIIKDVIDEYGLACNSLKHATELNSNLISTFKDVGKDYNIDFILMSECSVFHTYIRVANELLDALNAVYNNKDNKALLEKKQLLDDMLVVLEPYKSDDIEVIDSPISSLYSRIECEFEEINELVGQYENINNLMSCIGRSKNLAKKAMQDYDNLGERPVIIEEESGVATVLEVKKEDNAKKITDILKESMMLEINEANAFDVRNSCLNDIFLKEYSGYTVNELKFKIEELTDDLSTNEDKIESLKKIIENTKRDLENAESKESHPLSKNVSELKLLRNRLESMVEGVASKVTILEDLSAGKVVPENESNKLFLKHVWRYLGSRLETVQHVRNEYKVDLINMNERVIVSGDVQIRFKDMGTGESQLAYLKSLLNSNDERITIALFDEIDHMDSTIIGEIQSKLSQLYAEGKLLMGIMAAPGVGTEVVEYE